MSQEPTKHLIEPQALGYPALVLGGVPHVLNTPQAQEALADIYGYNVVFISQPEWNRLEKALLGPTT